MNSVGEDPKDPIAEGLMGLKRVVEMASTRRPRAEDDIDHGVSKAVMIVVNSRREP